MRESLARDGGTPVRSSPFPSWPIFGGAEEAALLRTLRSGAWGRTAGQEVAQFERCFADYHEAAEGIPASPGYAVPLYRQPLFEDVVYGPYTGGRSGLDYRTVCCPNCEAICDREGVWLEQRLLLGPRQDMDDIARAFEKVYENRERLARPQ